jgi:hypothetical protein
LITWDKNRDKRPSTWIILAAQDGDPNGDKSVTEDFAATYRQMSDEELERILADTHDLIEDARISLLAEFRSRGRTDKDAAIIAEAGRKRCLPLTETEGIDLHLTAQVGSVSTHNGTGRMFIGKRNRTYDKTYDYEEFDSTLFWTFCYVPVLSRGKFRLRRRVKSELPYLSREASYNFVIVRRLG